MLKLRLVAAALVPGLLIGAVRLWGHGASNLSSWVLIVLSGIALISVILLLVARHQTNEQPLHIIAVTDESAEVPAYLLTYVFPFVFLSVVDLRDVVAYAIFGVLLLVLILRTDLWKVNPVLLLVGFHIYVVDSRGGERVLLSRTRPRAGETVSVVRVASNVLKTA